MSEAHAAVDLTMSAEDLRALLELKEEVSRRRRRRRRRPVLPILTSDLL